MLVPVRADFFDMWASEDFFAQLAEEKAVRRGEVQIGVVGMCINPRTRSARSWPIFLRASSCRCSATCAKPSCISSCG